MGRHSLKWKTTNKCYQNFCATHPDHNHQTASQSGCKGHTFIVCSACPKGTKDPVKLWLTTFSQCSRSSCILYLSLKAEAAVAHSTGSPAAPCCPRSTAPLPVSFPKSPVLCSSPKMHQQLELLNQKDLHTNYYTVLQAVEAIQLFASANKVSLLFLFSSHQTVSFQHSTSQIHLQFRMKLRV